MNSQFKIPDEIWYDTKSLSQSFSLLKHRIVHLFLHMDIDLQRISEINKIKEKEAIEYLKEVLNEKENNSEYYRKKLTQLQYIIVGDKVVFPSANGSKTCSDGKANKCSPVHLYEIDKKDLLADGKSIYDLITQSDKERKILRSKEWKRLLSHAGFKNKNNNRNFSLDKKSEIFKFMCLMDCKIQKIMDCKISKKGNRSKNNKDITKILNVILNFNINKSNGSEIWFHRWFCELDDCLDKLIERLYIAQQKS